MLIIQLLVNENLLNAEVALSQADSGNIIELGRKYLLLLNSYCDELSKLRGAPETAFQQSSLARELTEQVKKAIRSAIEITTRERNQTESLLHSFTSISGHQAVETFNRLKYKGFDGWEIQADGIGSKSNVEDELMPVQKAIDTAGLLRREAYVSQKITFVEESVKKAV